MVDLAALHHPERIKAEIRARGTTLRDLSIASGLHPEAISRAVRQPWPAVEKIIADFLGIPPEQLWPDRYAPEGVSTRRLRAPKYRRGLEPSQRRIAGSGQT